MGVLGWVDWAYPISCACLFILSQGVLQSTLSHIWCKLNLPLFLLRVGLLTLMYIDSLIIWQCHGPISLLFGSFAVWWYAYTVTVVMYRGRVPLGKSFSKRS